MACGACHMSPKEAHKPSGLRGAKLNQMNCFLSVCFYICIQVLRCNRRATIKINACLLQWSFCSRSHTCTTHQLCTSKSMNHSRDATLVSLPSDVVHHHILPYLSRADLIILSMTCIKMQKLYSKRMLCSDEKSLSKTKCQSRLLDEIFRRGSFAQLFWFQETLKYLSMSMLNQNQTILLALRGDWRFST